MNTEYENFKAAFPNATREDYDEVCLVLEERNRAGIRGDMQDLISLAATLQNDKLVEVLVIDDRINQPTHIIKEKVKRRRERFSYPKNTPYPKRRK